MVGCEKIFTPFGDRFAYMFYRFDVPRNETAIITMGADTHIVYRWTVANAAGLYHYTSALKATSNIEVPSMNKVVRLVSVRPSDNTPPSLEL